MGMRRVIGAEHVDDALLDAPPDAPAVAVVADRRVHLGIGAKPLVAIGRDQRQMVRQHLDGGDILVVLQEDHLLAGRDMQDMDARAGLARDPHQPLRAGQRHLWRAPDRVARRIALDPQRHALAQHHLVFGMEGGAPARALQDLGDAPVVLDQQVAGGGAHEHLDAGRARQALQFRYVMGILMRAADPEGEVAMHAVPAAPDLVGQRLRRHRLRDRVRHLEDAGHAAKRGRARSALQVFLVVEPRLAEMHLAVDYARQDMQAGAIDDLAGRGLREIAERHDLSASNADIAHDAAILVHHRAALEDDVVSLGHGVSPGG